MTKVLQVSVMGRLQLRIDGALFEGTLSAKAQALLCYLAVTGRPHSRAALANLLWCDMPEADSRRNLRGVLAKLRPFFHHYLIISHKSLAFNTDSAYWLDVQAFHEGLSRFSTSHDLDELRTCVDLYRGNFLEDFRIKNAPNFEDWQAQQGLELNNTAIQLLLPLIDGYIKKSAYKLAIEYSRRLLGIDSLHEDGHRRLMLALALSGQRSAAMAQYANCRELLYAKLQVKPSEETAVLHQHILSGRIQPPTAANTLPATVSPFIAGPPITDPRQFFGRERELKRVFNLFKRIPLQNAAIIGARRSGKTSFLHYLRTITTTPLTHVRPDQRTNWLAEPEQYCWIFVDFQDPRLGEIENLLRYILTGMELTIPDPCDLENFMYAVSDHLTRPTIVLFDEIGVALERYTALDDPFWESLRSLATNQTNGRLAFVLSAHESPEKLAQNGGLGSPFFNIFGYTAMLTPLTEPEAQQLLAASPLPFSEADSAWMLEKSGRWPMPLQIFARERLLALEDGETDDNWKAESMRQARPFLKNS